MRNLPLVPAAAELGPLHAPRLLAPFLDAPRMSLEVLNLEAEIGHSLGSKRVDCCWSANEFTCVWGNVQSWTFGSSSTSMGAGLSSIMMSVTSLLSLFWSCCVISQVRGLGGEKHVASGISQLTMLSQLPVGIVDDVKGSRLRLISRYNEEVGLTVGECGAGEALTRRLGEV